VSVEFVGLLPTIYSTCASCCASDYVGACHPAAKSDQLNDYPAEVRADQDRMVELVQRLHAEFGPRVRLKAVGATNLRGIWLSVRYRLDSRLHVVVNGRRILPASVDDALIARAVREELGLMPIPDDALTDHRTAVKRE
jgi:hypothetical protein